MKRSICVILLVCLLFQLLPMTAGAAVTGTAEKRPGWGVATIRCQQEDGSYFFVDFSETAEGYTYAFTPPQGSYSIKVEYYNLSVWDGAVDISWYDARQKEFYLSTPAELAGLAALVNGRVDAATPDYRIRGNREELVSTKIEDFQLVGAGGGNVYGTVYRADAAHDFSDKTVYLTADMDMGGICNWTPIGGKYPMEPETGEYIIEAFFNGTLDGQGHRIVNLNCDRYTSKGYAYSQAVGMVGYMGELYDGEAAPKNPPALRNLSVSGSVYGRRMVGGLVGRVGGIPTGVYIENCANFAQVKNTDSKGIGGIVGAGWGKGAIVNCYNAGAVITTYACPAGGICGSNSGGMDIYCCYNVGTIDSSGNGRGRAIGGHDRGSYTVSDCYYLTGCDDDPDSGGWYRGTAVNISVSVQALSREEMQGEKLVALLNRNGEAFAQNPEGYPVLLWEKEPERQSCTLTLRQSEGGTVKAEGETILPAGTVLRLSNEPQTGYAFRNYTLNGSPLSGPYATLARDSVVSGLFEPMVSGTLKLENHPACTLHVVKDGTALIDGTMQQVKDYPVADGDALHEGDVLTVRAELVPGAAPEDLSYVYSGAFRYAFAYLNGQAATKTDTGKFTVTSAIATAPLSVSVEPYTTHKVWTQLGETDWYHEDQEEFTLYTPRQLAGFARLVKEGTSFAGKTVKLGADISLNNDDSTYGRSVRWFDGIGSLQNPFRGTFDGCGFKITQMTAVSQSSTAALFLATEGAKLQNIIVYGQAEANGSAAGLVAQAKNTQILFCENYGTVSATNEKAGGIAAYAEAGSVLKGCKNHGEISGTDGVGGIAGVIGDKDTQVTDSLNYGKITGDGASVGVGGIAGRMGGSLVRCANYGEITGKCWYMGGLAGVTGSEDGGRLTDCYNIGSVTNAHGYRSGGTGGLIGYGNYFRLENCYNRGNVAASAGTLGSILGKNSKRSVNAVDNTYGLDTSCPYVSNGEAALAGAETVTKEALASREFLDRLNRNRVFALENGEYPEFTSGCLHTQTVLENRREATCTQEGYSGDTLCLQCGAILSTGRATEKIPCPGGKFTDMPPASSWAHGGIDFALQRGLFAGISETAFDPEGSMNRAMLVTVLWRLEGKPAPQGTKEFADIPAGQWYTDAVLWAAENDVVNGVGQGRFDPMGKITREQMAAILFRYGRNKGCDTSKRGDLSAFPDGGQTSGWAREALAWANGENLISGSSQGSGVYLLPTGSATRAQVAAILMRYVNYVVNGAV